MKFKGRYILYFKGQKPIILENSIVGLGQQRLLQAAIQGVTLPITAFQVGLMDETPAYGANLASITTEPTAAGGYARQTLNANTTDWTVNSSGDEYYAESALLTFTATGADFSRTFSRMFLMESAGELISYSSPLAAPLLLLDTQSFQARYQIYLR
jgi:hypothetical protein